MASCNCLMTYVLLVISVSYHPDKQNTHVNSKRRYSCFRSDKAAGALIQ